MARDRARLSHATVWRPRRLVWGLADGSRRSTRENKHGPAPRHAREKHRRRESFWSITNARRRRNEQARRILGQLTSRLASTSDSELIVSDFIPGWVAEKWDSFDGDRDRVGKEIL